VERKVENSRRNIHGGQPNQRAAALAARSCTRVGSAAESRPRRTAGPHGMKRRLE
jgi:hypothetical protein